MEGKIDKYRRRLNLHGVHYSGKSRYGCDRMFLALAALVISVGKLDDATSLIATGGGVPGV